MNMHIYIYIYMHTAEEQCKGLEAKRIRAESALEEVP